ncbi:442_t:CDS:2 [Cetraspora pellucida]|uniref:442_t:CDS:1 n=1 Tax=Cetraspora pellucida TaxID=1433469 RepID=A0ACA9JYS9_9GLOM|nr:442_t:CDS:2 [Cetraspora pellucida]
MRTLYSSSRNDLYKSFDVSSSYDGSLIINVLDEQNRSKAIYALLQNGSTAYIDLGFVNKDIRRVFPLNKKFFFLLYDSDKKQTTGTVIDLDKNIVKDSIIVANGTVANSSVNVVPDIRLTSFLVYSQNNKVINWIACNLPKQDDSNIGPITNGSFVLPDNSILRSVFPNIDGSYGFITTEILYDNKNILNISMPNLFIYYRFLFPTTHQISENFLLYYARNISNMLYISCSSSYSENGNVCMMTNLVENVQNNSLFVTYQIDFLSSGAVIRLQSHSIQLVNTYDSSVFDINPLFYGGSIVTSWIVENNNTDNVPPTVLVNANDVIRPLFVSHMTAKIISPNGSEVNWDLNNIDTTGDTKFNVMRNNTCILFAIYEPNRWDIFSTDLPKFREDLGYENPNIILTYPNINDTISPFIDSFWIVFSNRISKSLNNITVYQTDTITNLYKPRKIFSRNSESCTILNNRLSCNVSPSIFNQWNSSYMIAMDNNFVKFSSTNEPIIDIEEDKWKITTIPNSAIGILRLTPDGTKKLLLSERSEFFKHFQQELIESVPTSSERIRLTNQIQYDPSVPSQYLVQIEIVSTKDPYQDSVSQIIKYLTELIKDKDTIIYMNNHTKYLDSSFGLVINLNLWDEIKLKLLGLSIGIIILTAIALWAHYKSPENPLFIKWFNQHKATISIFTICSGADVALFEFLTSRFAGFEIFNTPFSDITINWIYWATIINTLIEDIPQLVVQGNTLQSKEILSKFKHTFLIRNPEKSVKSYYKAAITTYKVWDEVGVPNSERVNLFSSNKIGLKESRILYDLVKNVTEEEIALVDADDLVREPEKILKKYCEMINVKFTKEMLEWKSERVGIWDSKMSGLYYVQDLNYLWHKNAMQSIGFDKTINNEEEIEYPQYVYDIIDENKPHYEYLFQYRIKL